MTDLKKENTVQGACTRCHKRYKFEDLSSDKQICFECKEKIIVVKCLYCLAEFEQGDSVSTICKNCTSNVKKFGKPGTCKFCQLMAAFANDVCFRCRHYIKRFGDPVTCAHCEKKSAFNRNDGKSNKNGKLLCWSCLQSHRSTQKRVKVNKVANKSQDSDQDTESKKAKIEPIDNQTDNSNPEKSYSFNNSSGTEQFLLINSLKERISSLEKLLAQKDQQLMEKDLLIADAKAKAQDSVQDLRTKLGTLQKQNSELYEQIGNKTKEIIQLQKKLSQGNKKKIQPPPVTSIF